MTYFCFSSIAVSTCLQNVQSFIYENIQSQNRLNYIIYSVVQLPSLHQSVLQRFVSIRLQMVVVVVIIIVGCTEPLIST